MYFNEKTRKIGLIYKTTANNGLYKKAKKAYLQSQRKIDCSYCPYNRKDNVKRKNSFVGLTRDSVNYPSWKDTNKVKKQWMKKKIEVIEIELINRVIFEVIY